MSYFGSGRTILSQLGITPTQPLSVPSQEITTLQSQVTLLQQQLNEQVELNKRLIREVEELGLAKDLAGRLSALQEFLGISVEQEPPGKISSTQFNSAFVMWAIDNKGLLLSDDEVKYLMRTYFKVPKDQHSKFPYRGHDDYFYKGLKWKTVNNSPSNIQMNPEQTVMMPVASPPQSPRNTGALSPAPVMTRQ